MSRRAWILAVVVLLIASSMIVLGPSSAHGATAPTVPKTAATHPAVSVIQVYTSSGECPYCNETYFQTGIYPYYRGENILYFAISDPADAKATFTITDPNATRDGLTNPVFSATVTLNNTTHEYFSDATGVSFTFPATLKIGGGWNVTASGALGGNATYPIYVGTYYEDLFGSPETGSVVLPGESITVGYQALSDVNGALDSAITNVAYNGNYIGANGTSDNLFPGGSLAAPASPIGSTTFIVPANATFGTYIIVNVWVAIYAGTAQAENESHGVDYAVGAVAIDFFDILQTAGNACNSDGSQTSYPSGAYVQACALVGAVGGTKQFSPVPNLPVAINFWNGTNVVTPPGNTPTSLVSNGTGYVSFSFWANSPQFSSGYKYPWYNSANLTVTDPSAKPVPASSHDIAWWNQTFFVDGAAAWAGLTVGLNQLSYYPGQSIVATWAINPTNPTVGTVTATSYYIYGTNNAFLGQGAISSTSDTGTIPVTLPTGYVGEFVVEVWASNSSTQFEGSTTGYVVTPTLYLTPSSTTFTPGSTVTVEAAAYGDSSLSAPTIVYQVYSSYGLGQYSYGSGGLVMSGTVTNGSTFTIQVPSTGAPDRYYVYAYLSSATSGTVATAVTLDLFQSWGYNVFVGVSTASSYSDGSYQPGQTLTVTYQISPYGNAPLPTIYSFQIYLYGTQISNVISTPSTSGSVQITIPSGWQTGIALIEIELEGTYLSGNSCGGGYCYGETAITINAHPSALSMEIGAGSGLTVGWLILLIIILVVAIVLFLLIRRKKGSAPPSGGASVTTPMNPPAPAPSGPGATQWQEPPPPASDGQPPMPAPPPGAQ